MNVRTMCPDKPGLEVRISGRTTPPLIGGVRPLSGPNVKGAGESGVHLRHRAPRQSCSDRQDDRLPPSARGVAFLNALVFKCRGPRMRHGSDFSHWRRDCMPVAPRPACLVPCCPHRANYRGRCRQHASQMERERRARARHSDLHGSRRWKDARAAFLARPEHRLCFYCAQDGKQTRAECIDHSRAPKGDPTVFWDQSRWVPSCLRCNTKKANAVEGGFGRWG
jgi:hypothetical protein